MAETFRYLIVGRGRWGPRMQAILAAEGRDAILQEQSRQAPSEAEPAYCERLRASFQASGAQIAWLCVPPGRHIPLMMAAAIDAGMHVVVEKPWLCSAEETERLALRAEANHTLLAIHYEYCLMGAAETWRRERNGGSGLAFGGRMHVDRPDHIGLPALDNLGSHLFSLQEYCVPGSEVTTIDCAYRKPNDRRVWLEDKGEQVAGINLLANQEPIIQRFISRLEAAAHGAAFPFDLRFALRVAERTARWQQRQALRQEPL
jgi:predicted dehydrogenase